MNRFLAFFCIFKKLEKIEIEFNLITKSGNKIYTIEKEIKPLKDMVIRWSDFSWWDYHRQIENDKEYKKLFDDIARDLLNKFQKKERKNIRNGWLESGDYIVKCSWDFSTEFDFAEYDEYKKCNLVEKSVTEDKDVAN